MITSDEVLALAFTLPILSIIIVALRIYVKCGRWNQLGIDDYLILISLLLVCGDGAVLIIGALPGGFGGTPPNPASSNAGGPNTDSDTLLLETKKLIAAINFSSVLVYGAEKLSVLFFYKTIFCGRPFTLLSNALIGVTVIWMPVNFLLVLLQCGSHISYLWTSAANIAQYCISGFKLAIYFAITDVLLDLIILATPVYWIWKLQMSFWKRIAVIAVFFFGAVTIASSILRLVITSKIYPSHYTDTNQFEFETNVAYYGTLEAGFGVIAACLPTLGPLLTRAGRERLRRRGHKKWSHMQEDHSHTGSLGLLNKLPSVPAEETQVSHTGFRPSETEGGDFVMLGTMEAGKPSRRNGYE